MHFCRQLFQMEARTRGNTDPPLATPGAIIPVKWEWFAHFPCLTANSRACKLIQWSAVSTGQLLLLPPWLTGGCQDWPRPSVKIRIYNDHEFTTGFFQLLCNKNCGSQRLTPLSQNLSKPRTIHADLRISKRTNKHSALWKVLQVLVSAVENGRLGVASLLLLCAQKGCARRHTEALWSWQKRKMWFPRQ